MFGGLNVWFHQNEDYNSWAYSALFSELAADSSTIVFSWNGLQANFSPYKRLSYRKIVIQNEGMANYLIQQISFS